MNHKLDTDEMVFFYEQEFYVLSNFSAFAIWWPQVPNGVRFDTSEAAYHSEKFPNDFWIQILIRQACSAHEAFKIAEKYKDRRRSDWDEVKVKIMLNILYVKTCQHEYVYRKLMETGNRRLVEDSWRDTFWGWGPNHDGQNMLGQLWMQLRTEFQTGVLPIPQYTELRISDSLKSKSKEILNYAKY